MASSSSSADVVLTCERIDLTCPITQCRIRQAGRGPSCTHASAFCTSALTCLQRNPAGSYLCPLCDAPFASVCVDGALTLFLSEWGDCG